MGPEYYDLAGEIVLKLNKIGNTTVTLRLSPLWEKIKNLKDKITDDVKEIEKLYNYLIKTIIGNVDIKDDLLVSVIIYLMVLDSLSDSLRMQTNTLTASAEALNKTNRDEIEIYYTYPGIARDNNFNEHFTYVLSNLIFFIKDKKLYKRLTLNNIYISKDIKNLRIGFASYPPCTNLILEEQENRIIAKERTDLDDYDTSYLQTVKHLIDENCNVIFGPEMHGSKALDREIRQLFFKGANDILVCPSWHRHQDGQILNRADIYYRHELSRKRAYLDKCVAAKFTNKKIEGISNDESIPRNLILIHVKGLGRILFLICRDFLSIELSKLIEDLNIDIVFIQCYTPDLTAFKDFADKVQNKRLIILGNSCKAIKDAYKDKSDHPSPLLYFYYDFEHEKDSDPKCCFESMCKKECAYSHDNCYKILEVIASEYTIGNKTKEGIFVSQIK